MSRLTLSMGMRYCGSVRAAAELIEELLGTPPLALERSVDGVRPLSSELLGIARTLKGATDVYEAAFPSIIWSTEAKAPPAE